VSLFGLVLTPLRHGAALVTRPASAVTRPIGAAIAPLGVVGELDAIRRRVETLEVEVTRMRQAVEDVVGEVSQVREQTAPLGRLAARFSRRRPA